MRSESSSASTSMSWSAAWTSSSLTLPDLAAFEISSAALASSSESFTSCLVFLVAATYVPSTQ